MELDQIGKRIDWLDDERRKDKTALATLEERLANLEASLPPLVQQLKELSSELSRATAQLTRFDQIESNILQLRVEANRSLDAIEKARAEHDREAEKSHRSDIELVNKSIAEVRKGLEPIPDLRKSLQARIEEEYRLARLIEEQDQKVVESRRSDEEYRRSLRLLDEGRRQDAKRLTDIQGELSALRKRQDEQRGKVDLTSENSRKLELRISELQGAESERRTAQGAFLEKQTLWQVERDRVWKDMQSRFEDITQRATNLDAQLQTLDTTQRAVKRSQEAFDEITQRFERRLNEISEMQRLVEDRFRQEWVAYKADDQKRWTNYTLASEEQQREFNRIFEKYSERLVLLEDMTIEMRDQIQQVIDEDQKRLQGLVTAAHEWMDEFERTFGKQRA